MVILSTGALLFDMKLGFFLLFAFFSFNLYAQQTPTNIEIKGALIDSLSSQPLGYATVTLFNLKNSKPLSSVVTKPDGSFSFDGLPNADYQVSVAYIGYTSKTIKISAASAKGGPVINLAKIPLLPQHGELKEVAVRATRPTLSQQIDRIAYDVQADPESKANDALEMLKKVPMVTVDGNDIIQLKGSTSFRIFINGKPSALMTNDPADVLKGMPAGTIQKIEVITVPPAKYDAEGLSGIINIITLKQNTDGITGSIFARYNNIMGERGSITLAAKKGKLGLNTFFGIGRQPTATLPAGSQLTTFSQATSLSQQGTNTNSGHFNNGQAQLSYEADSLNLLTAAMDFTNRNYIRDALRNSQFIALPDSVVQGYQFNNAGTNSINAFDFNANYQHTFKHDKNQLLSVAYQYAYNATNLASDITFNNRFNYNASNYNQQNNSGLRENTLQADYIKPINKLIAEVGAKVILRNNFSSFGSQNFNEPTGKYFTDTALTNRFSYQQNVYSIYNSYQLKIKKWAFKAGLRAENTVIGSHLISGGDLLDQHYLNLIPAISSQVNYPETGSFTLGFTERIERPGIQQLNPFVDRSNTNSITTGNPNLRPVVNHIIELSYSKFAHVTFNGSINYAFANNTIQSVTGLLNDTLSKTTYSNLGKNRSAGSNISLNYPLTGKLLLNINGQFSHLWITGIYNSAYYKNDGNQGNINAFARYSFNRDLNSNFNFGYESGNIYLQGKASDFIFTSVNVIKDFLNKRLTASITIYNPFKTYNTNSTYTKTADFQQYSYTQNYYRSFRFGCTYKFGALKSQAPVSHHTIKNDDVKSTGGGTEN